jgi:Kef-type K+ transport system membrane component KefB
MTFDAVEMARLLFGVAVVLTIAHTVGFLFVWLRQPRVIGEIVGGMLLGPTGLAAIAPDWTGRVFPPTGASHLAFNAFEQLGLLFLLFCSGMEIRSTFQRGERRIALLITLFGTLLPFLAGLVIVTHASERYLGSAGDSSAFLLVFAIAIAVTSIPVISRIFFDLKLLETSFARIVLSSAVIEDVILYVVLSVAIGMVHVKGEDLWGLPQLLDLEPTAMIAYHVVTTVVFLVVLMTVGRRLFRWLLGLRANVLHRSSPTAFLIVVMLTITGVAISLGIAPMFGAFGAGIVVGASSERVTLGEAGMVGRRATDAPRGAIREFAFAFFVPFYFALVGMKLNLWHGFEISAFLLFLCYACLAKLASVYLGAAVAGESRRGRWNLAVAMNARGGPCIVLASVAFQANIINEAFYCCLVLLALLTSMLAGWWLGLVSRRGDALR